MATPARAVDTDIDRITSNLDFVVRLAIELPTTYLVSTVFMFGSANINH